uniref:Addiction module toxin, RelE/StbE family n=1 Tax=Candidatus Kentrum sp. FM TaxID=2126340 RepID=A0A450TCF6_9GAMM|nr:MAG: addiction module toxin, RelE/StbE family [Candidatus Kentron sp. FM]VFJ64540.1 MAG: addiction module toxin, RelE/StbE family [Candidatus Kentron sp. FM]VFK15147.1 MAG: addiction module toxin, RelE/StbE family [Candidatus Kentron sp. FM]
MSYTSILSTLVSAQVQNSAIESTRQAYRDIDAVHDYIARDNPIAAQGVLDKIEAMIDHLPRNPALGRAGRVMRTRELVVPSVPYIVVYSLEEEFIDILAIIHTARRWPVRFRRSQHG